MAWSCGCYGPSGSLGWGCQWGKNRRVKGAASEALFGKMIQLVWGSSTISSRRLFGFRTRDQCNMQGDWLRGPPAEHWLCASRWDGTLHPTVHFYSALGTEPHLAEFTELWHARVERRRDRGRRKMQSQQPHRPLRGKNKQTNKQALEPRKGLAWFLENLAYFWAGSQKADAGALVGFESGN